MLRIKSQTNAIILFLVLLCIFILSFMPTNAQYVAAPAAMCIIIVVTLWMKLRDRDNAIPFFDVGIFCALVTMLYTVYPLLNYWANGFSFGSDFNDNRLQYISPKELGEFHLRHVLYLFSFVISYLLFRRKEVTKARHVVAPNKYSRKVILFYFIALTGYFYFLQHFTGLNYNVSYSNTDIYNANISLFSSLPLVLIQISGKLWGVLFLFKLAVLLIVVSRCRQNKWLVVLIVWIAVEVVQTFIIKGARTGLIWFLLATALYYHRIIKPLSVKFLLVSGIILLATFILMGHYRSFSGTTTFSKYLADNISFIFSSNNEFQVLLGTAYDVLRLKTAGVHFPSYLYINDIIVAIKK